MLRPQILIVSAAALLLAAACGPTEAQQADLAVMADTVKVTVAAREIPAGTTLAAGDLVTEIRPSKFVPADVVAGAGMDAMVGKVTAITIAKGNALVTNALKDEPKALEPIVRTLGQAEHRVAPNGKAGAVLLAEGHEAYIGTLSLEAGAKVPTHRDATEEYIYVLRGSGMMTIDGKDYPVEPETIIFMPANAEVSFTNGAEELLAVQVFAGPEPAKKYDDWKQPSAEK